MSSAWGVVVLLVWLVCASAVQVGVSPTAQGGGTPLSPGQQAVAVPRHVSQQCGAASSLPASSFFGIQIVDEDTGRGVPCVRLATVNNIEYFTDSAGYVAFEEPGLMNTNVFFNVQSDGYEFPLGFLYRGFEVNCTEGGSTTRTIHRINIAKRLYRLTGGGIYRDSCLLGRSVPIEHPLLDSKVFGQDSVLSKEHNGRVYWFWGDTNRPSFPLGNFATTGATSELPPTRGGKGLPPSVGVNFKYFQDASGFTKHMTDVKGQGPTWIGGVTSLTSGLYAFYAKIGGPDGSQSGWGSLKWSDTLEMFEVLSEYPQSSLFVNLMSQHTFQATDAASNQTYIYFSQPFPFVRCPATEEAFSNTADVCECYTPLVPGTRMDGANTRVERTSDGGIVYGWKKNTQPVFQPQQTTLINNGLVELHELAILFRAANNQTCVQPQAHGGSVFWNEYREKYVMIAGETFGQGSFLGEIWYSEADAPEGPWLYAIKIVTHNVTGMSFYNPVQHQVFDDGPLIYFSATFVTTFSSAVPVARYDYNNIVYMLDLSSSDLQLQPVAGMIPCQQGQLASPWKPWQLGLAVAGVAIFVVAMVGGLTWWRRRRRQRRQAKARREFVRDPRRSFDEDLSGSETGLGSVRDPLLRKSGASHEQRRSPA